MKTAKSILRKHYKGRESDLSSFDEDNAIIPAMHEYASLVSEEKDRRIRELEEAQLTEREKELVLLMHSQLNSLDYARFFIPTTCDELWKLATRLSRGKFFNPPKP